MRRMTNYTMPAQGTQPALAGMRAMPQGGYRGDTPAREDPEPC